MGDDQRPVAVQKVRHHRGHAHQVRAQAELPRNAVGQRLALLGELHRVLRLHARVVIAIVTGLPAGLQRQAPLLEVLRRGHRQLDQLAHGSAHRLHEVLELRIELVVVLEAALRNGLDEQPCRMRLVAKKARVIQRHAQQRRLQRHEGLAHGRQHALVAGHLVDQRAHRIQTQHLADLLGLGLELHQRARARLHRAVFAPVVRRQRQLHPHGPRRTLHHTLAAPLFTVQRVRGGIERCLRAPRQPAHLGVHGIVVTGRQGFVVFLHPLRSIEKLANHRRPHGRTRLRELVHSRHESAGARARRSGPRDGCPVRALRGGRIARAARAAGAEPAPRGATATATTALRAPGTLRKLGAAATTPARPGPAAFGQSQAIARLLHPAGLQQGDQGLVQCVQFGGKGAADVARPERTHLGGLGLVLKDAQQRPAVHIRAKRVELGAHHGQPEHRAHQRVEHPQRTLDHGHGALLQTRSLDKARHFGVIQQGQGRILAARPTPGVGLGVLAQRGLDALHQHLREFRAHARRVAQQRRMRVAQLQAARHRARIALFFLDGAASSLNRAIEHGRGMQQRLALAALDQGVVQVLGVHRLDEIRSNPSKGLRHGAARIGGPHATTHCAGVQRHRFSGRGTVAGHVEWWAQRRPIASGSALHDRDAPALWHQADRGFVKYTASRPTIGRRVGMKTVHSSHGERISPAAPSLAISSPWAKVSKPLSGRVNRNASV